MRPRRRTYQRGSDLEIALEITLEEAFRGITKEVQFRTYAKCSHCGGTGAEKGSNLVACDTCGGQGEIREQKKTFFGSFSQVKSCINCRGTGRMPKKPCSVCKSTGRLSAENKVSVDILPGIQNNQVIKIKGRGEAGERGTAEGDLYIRITVKPHNVFTRKDDDLIVKKNSMF